MSDWYPRALAAASDHGGAGGDGPHEPAPQGAGTPRRRRSSKATPGYAGNWRARNVEIRQRIAQWFRWTRETKLHMSRYELADAALADGVELTEPVVRRLEHMTDRAVAEARHWLAIEYVLWLATYSGQTFIDVARFLVGGDWAQLGVLTDSTPSTDAMADRVRTTFLNLTDARKQGALDHLVFLQSLDDLERQRAPDARRQPPKAGQAGRKRASRQTAHDMNAQSEYAIDPGTQAVIDELQQGAEELRQHLIEHERNNPRKRAHDATDDQQDDQQHKHG